MPQCSLKSMFDRIWIRTALSSANRNLKRKKLPKYSDRLIGISRVLCWLINRILCDSLNENCLSLFLLLQMTISPFCICVGICVGSTVEFLLSRKSQKIFSMQTNQVLLLRNNWLTLLTTCGLRNSPTQNLRINLRNIRARRTARLSQHHGLTLKSGIN